MDSNSSCSSPFFWIRFLKKKNIKKENVYNLKTCKISEVKKNSTESIQTKTYYKYDKYRPSIGEEGGITIEANCDHREKRAEMIYREECRSNKFGNPEKIIFCQRKYRENIESGFEKLVTVEKAENHACCVPKYQLELEEREKWKNETELRQIVKEALKFKPSDEWRCEDTEKKIMSKQSDEIRGKREKKLRARNIRVTSTSADESSISEDEQTKFCRSNCCLKNYQERYKYRRRCSAEKRLLFRNRCKSNHTQSGKKSSSMKFTCEQNEAVLSKVEEVQCTKTCCTLNKKRWQKQKGNNYSRHQARNAYGQVIIDPEENLSDKEVYPGQSSSVPAIEITKENLQDENYSEEEFLETHQSNRNIHYNQSSPPQSHGPLRSHLERGRSPPPHSGQDRVLPHPNCDVWSCNMLRDNREYHHSLARSAERKTRGMNDSHMKPGRGLTQPQPSPVNRQHPAPTTATLDDKSRLVVALFHYNPLSMSPNSATSHEELAFSADDQIKILSDKDLDRFYWGECHSKQGYVPQSMITDLENAPKTLLKKIKQQTKYSDMCHSVKVKKMIALYNYDPHENSPNLDSEAEISFNQGQIIYIEGEPDDDGFYLGEVDGMQGLVPSNYLQEIEEHQEDDRIKLKMLEE